MMEIGVPRTLLGDYLARIKAMRLANAYLERSQCLASRQTFICAADNLSARADRKMVIFYVYLFYFLKKSRFYRTDTQIKTIPLSAKEKPSHTILCVSAVGTSPPLTRH